MSKRKEEEDGDSSDVSLIDVDFEFFDPNPNVDFLALKRLLVQLFQSDAELLQINKLAELILSQPLVGTTVKTDGIESDPYAFLTVLNMHVHREHTAMQAIISYILSKSSAHPEFNSTLHSMIGPQASSSQNHVAFVFSERLINMPVQIVPPMYRMLTNEIQWAIDENEPYTFTHFLFVSRTYRLSADEAAEREATSARRSKRHKTKETQTRGSAPSNSILTESFHPEDELIQKVAIYLADYDFTTTQPREKDAFGLDVAGRMMLVPADRMQVLIDSMNEAYTVSQ